MVSKRDITLCFHFCLFVRTHAYPPFGDIFLFFSKLILPVRIEFWKKVTRSQHFILYSNIKKRKSNNYSIKKFTSMMEWSICVMIILHDMISRIESCNVCPRHFDIRANVMNYKASKCFPLLVKYDWKICPLD